MVVCRGPLSEHDDLAEHHFHEVVRRERGVRLSYHFATSHHRGDLAQLLDFLELVGDKDDHHSVVCEPAQDLEELL